MRFFYKRHPCKPRKPKCEYSRKNLNTVVYLTTYSQVASRKPFLILFSLGLKVGDIILEANGDDFTWVTLHEAYRQIEKKDILCLKITRAELQDSVLRIRSWNPSGNI